MVLDGFGSSGVERFATVSPSEGDVAPDQRALVAVPPTEPAEGPCPYSRRPAAPFLAHLIATACGEPQTRAHRRAEPHAAADAYAAAYARMNGVIHR